MLLSSHHLSEVEQVCSHVLVMNRGRLVTHGTVDELIGAAKSVYVEVDDRERARTILSALPTVGSVHLHTTGLVVELNNGNRADIAAALVGAGLRLETLMAGQGLEDAFLELLAASDSNESNEISGAAVPA